MDATVDQFDGYRFVYTLPFARDRMFVEDTYYSDTPELDREMLGRADRDLCRGQGLEVRSRSRARNAGSLPVVIGGDFDRYWAAAARAWPRPACAQGCSTRPPAIRCPTRCAPPR